MAEVGEEARRQAKSLADCIVPLHNAVRELEEISSCIPEAEDFHFFSNFDQFRSPISDLQSRAQAILSDIGSFRPLRTEISASDREFPADSDESYDWLVSLQDDILEGVGTALDELGVKPGKGPRDFLLDKKKCRKDESVKHKGVKVATRQNKLPIPFHVRTLARPQDKFDYPVDNSNLPFRHLSREALLGEEKQGTSKKLGNPLEDHARTLGLQTNLCHPLEEELKSMAFLEDFPNEGEPIKPKALSETPFTYVESLSSLEEMASKLRASKEFAVDLENHHYRSFQGFVCLMQISTRSEDFVIDTLTLREHVGPVLRKVFANPSIRKIIHGSDRDVVWLQRDFGIYLCNAFDTGQAARVLHLESCGLAYLLHTFCQVNPDKRYQLADWRLRPLTSEMLRYAREDTHYLLYIYDKLKEMLRDGQYTENLYLEVCTRSRDLCLQLYEKELLTEKSFQQVYGLAAKNFQPEQLAIVAGLYEWRDKICRKEDESTGYVLPNNLILRLAEEAPEDAKKLRGLLKNGRPLAASHTADILKVIREAKSKPFALYSLDSLNLAAAQLKNRGQVNSERGLTEPSQLTGQSKLKGQQGSDGQTSYPTAELKSTIQSGQLEGQRDSGGQSKDPVEFTKSQPVKSQLSIQNETVQLTKETVQHSEEQSKSKDRLVQVVQIKRSAVAEAISKPFGGLTFSTLDSEDEEDEDKEAMERARRIALSFQGSIRTVIATPVKVSRDLVEDPVKSAEFPVLDDSVVDNAGPELDVDNDNTKKEEDPQQQNPSASVLPEFVDLDAGNEDDTKNDERKFPRSLNERYGKQHTPVKRHRRHDKHTGGAKKTKIEGDFEKGKVFKGESFEKGKGFKGEYKRPFDPYRNAQFKPDGIKAGKKRQVFPRSGNRSATFK